MRGGSIGPLPLLVGWVGRIPRDPGGVPFGGSLPLREGWGRGISHVFRWGRTMTHVRVPYEPLAMVMQTGWGTSWGVSHDP